MIRLPALRDHFRQMSQSEHLLDCPSVIAREPYWESWRIYAGEDGKPQGMLWMGPRPKWEPPHCDGCLSNDERAWFARLADEIDGYLGEQMTLLDVPNPTRVVCDA